MLTSAMSIVLGLAALQAAPQAAPQANAQVVSRVTYSCDGCIAGGQLNDRDLEGALAMKQVGAGTYFFAVDGPNHTSVAYQATMIDALNNSRQPHRELTGRRYLVMKPVANPFTDLADTMLSFYRAQPAGWTKAFTPSASQLRLGRGIVALTEPTPTASLTFPDASINVWNVTAGGADQNGFLGWANGQMTGKVAVAQQYLHEVTQHLATSGTYGFPPTVFSTVRFTDGSSIQLVADTRTATGQFRVDRSYGSARDKNNNNVPIGRQDVGGQRIGDTAMYNYNDDPKDWQQFLKRAQLWDVKFAGTPSQPQGPTLTCTATTDERGNSISHCQFY